MSKVINCPSCNGKAKIIQQNEKTIYQAIQNEDLIKKVGQLKKALQKFKEKSERLEEELKEFKTMK